MHRRHLEVVAALERLRYELVRNAVVDDARVEQIRSDYNGPQRWEFIIRLRGGQARQHRWILLADELEMDPQTALAHFLRRVAEEAHRMVQEHRIERYRLEMIDRQVNPPWEFAAPLTATEVNIRAEEFAGAARRAMRVTERHFHEMMLNLPPTYQRHAPPNTAAHKKARELFIRTAGMDAYQQLNGGSSLPIRGSAGTPYHLRKQASFCVTNQETGVEYCAVVPGVPIWDHLLGIKLMVEHDEPRFLATANSSVGRNAMIGALRNDRYRW